MTTPDPHPEDTMLELAIALLRALPPVEADEIAARILSELDPTYRDAFVLLSRAHMRRKAA